MGEIFKDIDAYFHLMELTNDNWQATNNFKIYNNLLELIDKEFSLHVHINFGRTQRNMRYFFWSEGQNLNKYN